MGRKSEEVGPWAGEGKSLCCGQELPDNLPLVTSLTKTYKRKLSTLNSLPLSVLDVSAHIHQLTYTYTYNITAKHIQQRRERENRPYIWCVDKINKLKKDPRRIPKKQFFPSSNAAVIIYA